MIYLIKKGVKNPSIYTLTLLRTTQRYRINLYLVRPALSTRRKRSNFRLFEPETKLSLQNFKESILFI